MIGKEINGFHIVEKLGQGGMAEVYKAIDLKLEREVAIKFLRTNLEEADINRQRFELEARALAKLRHAHIVSILGYGEYEDRPYLVMDYIPGGTLKDSLGKAMNWQDALALLVPIAKALHYAHGKKIIHRDVKPSNILLTEDGQPMLTDFGVAKMLEAEKASELTGTNVGLGTPHYMSPEQGRSQKIGPKTDIYSLGVVLYEMITGRKPYEADTPFAVLLKHIEDPIPNPRQAVKNLPEDIEHLILKALSKNPSNRFEDMLEMAVALEGTGVVPTPRATRPNLPKRLPIFAVIGVLVLTLVYWGWQASQGSGGLGGLFAGVGGQRNPVLFRDDFESDRIDVTKWSIYAPIDSSYLTFTQSDGFLKADIGNFFGDRDAGYSSVESWPLAEITSVGARIFYDKTVDADWLSAAFGLHTIDGTHIVCDIKIHASDEELHCDIFNFTIGHHQQLFGKIPVQAGEWVDVRLEIEHSPLLFHLYVNDEWLGSDSPNADSLALFNNPFKGYVSVGATRLRDTAMIGYDDFIVRGGGPGVADAPPMVADIPPGSTEGQPTSTTAPIAPTAPQPTAFQVSEAAPFDDFSIGTAQVPFDRSRWRLTDDPIACEISWMAGRLDFVRESQSGGAGCFFEPAAFGRSVDARIELFGATILVANNFQGAGCCAHFSTDLFLGRSNSPESDGWVACAVHVGPDFVVGVFEVKSRSQQEVFRRDKQLEFGRAYDVYVENDRGLISCFFDGVLLGQADIQAPIVGGTFNVGWAANTSVTFQLDDVLLTP